MIAHGPWRGRPGLRHGFLDRHDCRDAPPWPRALEKAGVFLPLARPRQVHGATVLLAEAATDETEGDAVVATRPGIAAGVLTADCAPVLLCDRRGRAVAAVHAGWRGAAAGVLDATLEVLRSEAGIAPDEVEMAIGPAIGACCYEVGPDVRDAFVARHGAHAETAFAPRGQRFLLDLRRALASLAGAAGMAPATVVGPCTRCDPAYASYRRDGQAAHRQLSFIALA